jgi:hypothetical protein
VRSVLAPDLRQVTWLDTYGDFNNPEEFIQVYRMVIEAAGGGDRVKANNLATALSRAIRSWLINLPKGTIYS